MTRPVTPPPAPKTTWLVVTGLALALVIGVATVIGALAINSRKSGAPAAPVTSATATATPAVVVDAETTPTLGPTPSATDFELTPKTTEKQCFGTAGCSVTVKVEVGYEGPALSSDDTWEVTYELTGDESGPIIGSFELTGEQYDQNEVSMSTPSSKTKIKVKVTSVSKVG
jgi:hypothetical protein